MTKKLDNQLFDVITPFMVNFLSGKLHKLLQKQNTRLHAELTHEIEKLLKNINYASELIKHADNISADQQTFTPYESLNECIDACSKELDYHQTELKLIATKDNEKLAGNVINLNRLIKFAIHHFIKLTVINKIIVKFTVEKKSKTHRALHLSLYTKIDKRNAELLSQLHLRDLQHIKYANDESLPFFTIYYSVLSLGGSCKIKIKNKKLLLDLSLPFVIYKRRKMEDPKNKFIYTGKYNFNATEIIKVLSEPENTEKTVVSQNQDSLFSNPKPIADKKNSRLQVLKSEVRLLCEQGDGYNIINQHGQINLLGQLDQFGSLNLHGQMQLHGKRTVYAQSIRHH